MSTVSTAWEQAKPTMLASLSLPAEAGEHPAARAALLDGPYREIAARVPTNSQIVFDDDGRPHVAALEPEPEPACARVGGGGAWRGTTWRVSRLCRLPVWSVPG
ncbi:hypothetical protein OIE51_01875 [Streptomyces sp. NBC_01803]|nr:hypothetical protein [Streptomyces sp. NBC_01803]WSA43050.1 hypothetical protein OIE51_01875 [Streptomyces sp. NBC_01803]